MWVHTAIRPSHGSVLILHPGFLFSGLVVRGAFHRVPPPLSSFGMWSPFRVFSVFCHLIANEGGHWRVFFFLCVGTSRVGVRSYFPCVLGHLVIAPKGWCQRFSLACHCSSQYPSSPGFLCGFARGLGCATLLCLWLCAHLRRAWGLLCFLTVLRPPSGSGSTGSSG